MQAEQINWNVTQAAKAVILQSDWQTERNKLTYFKLRRGSQV